MLGGSKISWQKWKLFRARLTLLEADLVRCLVAVGDFAGDVESLATEGGRESNLEVDIGVREGNVGESGNSVGWAGVFFYCCWGGMMEWWNW